MIVSIYVFANNPASKIFSLPVAFSQRFNVFSCGQATQDNTSAKAIELDKVNIGVQWNYPEASTRTIYVFAIGI